MNNCIGFLGLLSQRSTNLGFKHKKVVSLRPEGQTSEIQTAQGWFLPRLLGQGQLQVSPTSSGLLASLEFLGL